jgi:hypothetical protein
MAFVSNLTKTLQAVLYDPKLMEFGKYTADDFKSMDQALCSDNYVVNVVAQIIKRVDEDVTDATLWKEINDYLRKNV